MDADKAVCLLYVPCADADEARRIGGMLLDARLAACANVLAPMLSLYDWQGARQEVAEVPLLVKTTTACRDVAMKTIASAHSYDVPGIIEIATGEVNAPFLAFVTAAMPPC